MKFVSGELFWTNVNPVTRKYEYLSENIECDVLVIGGGITGALCAYYFADAGIDTVIVDKNIIGYGSTSASTSILQYEVDSDLTGLCGFMGFEKASNAFKMVENSVYEIGNLISKFEDKCGFEEKECLYYTDNESYISYFKKEYELRLKAGFEVEFIDDKKAKSMFSFPIKAGIFSKKGGGQIDPYRFAHTLIFNGCKKNLRVYENTEVENVIPNDYKVIVKIKNNFTINAKKVIIAYGFSARNLIDKKISTLTRSFTVVTKPIKDFKGWFNKCIIRDNSSPYYYLRTTEDNRIMIGGEDIEIGGENSTAANLTNEDAAANEKYLKLEKKLKSMFSDIKDIEVEYRFSGIFGETKDGLPYIGEYKSFPNCYFCLGYGSNGILYAVLGAKLILDLYMGKRNEEIELFSFDR